MSFNSLKLRNFQAHKQTVLQLDAGITSIVGPSDVGKSSILRALRWVCLNDLMGDSFIREGAKDAEVILKLEGHSVLRCKGTRNAYELDEDKEFNSIARDVPKAIAQLLEVNEINFQAQHDSPFLFCESAPEVSRKLNAVVDLSVIDTALSNIASATRQAQERKTVCGQRLEELKQEQEATIGQEQRVEDFAKLKERNEQHLGAQEDYDKLELFLAQIDRSRHRASKAQAKAEELLMVADLGKNAWDGRRAASQLGIVIGQIELKQNIAAPPDFSEVEDTHVVWLEAEAAYDLLFDALRNVVDASGDARSKATALEEAEAKFHKSISGKLCPICQRPLP